MRASVSDDADGGARPRSDRAQHLVADGVAVGVVDRLEAVDVDQQQRERTTRGDGRIEGGIEGAAVRQARQRVLVGHPALAALGGHEVRLEVLDGRDEPGVGGAVHDRPPDEQMGLGRIGVEERREVRRDLDDGQRPREAGREEVRDVEGREDEHGPEVGVDAPAHPQAEGDERLRDQDRDRVVPELGALPRDPAAQAREAVRDHEGDQGPGEHRTGARHPGQRLADRGGDAGRQPEEPGDRAHEAAVADTVIARGHLAPVIARRPRK